MAKRPPFFGIEQTAPDPLAAAPQMGDNSGTIDLALLLEPTAIEPLLASAFAPFAERTTALLAGRDRFLAQTIDGIQDDGIQGRAGELAKQLRDHGKQIDKARDDIKRPVLNAGRQIDAYAKNRMIDPLEAGAKEIVSRMTVYARKKADAEQQRLREEAAERARIAAIAAEKAEQERREAEALAGAAAPQADTRSLDAALQAEQDAYDAAERQRRTTTADASRVRSDLGVTSSLRSRRAWELLDLKALVAAVADGTAPSNVLMPNKTILDAMAKDRGQADLPGLRFYDDTNVTLR